eukprot:TRINITY_DN123387_c0_g1_i1.p1 TRINITY_DN123387_c0_g1~~TRINITY_DN123387_c0_g1_i1.p1  ORF type:complete len:337 (-),score=31.74 TRINITY_DN123387_c0_g1_i1:463-1473(-)
MNHRAPAAVQLLNFPRCQHVGIAPLRLHAQRQVWSRASFGEATFRFEVATALAAGTMLTSWTKSRRIRHRQMNAFRDAHDHDRRKDLNVYVALVLVLFITGTLWPQQALAASDFTWIPFDSAKLVTTASEWIRGDASGAGPLPFIAAHILAIVVCFPGTVAFELAAGVVFGFLPGVLVVATAKGAAAVVTFFLAQGLGGSPVSGWIRDRLTGLRNSADGKGWAERLQRGVRRDAFRFCLLARLSPVPSWVNKYGLPFVGVQLAPFLLATMLGMLPPLAANVYSGSAAVSLAAAISGQTSSIDGIGLVLGLLSSLSGVAVIQRIASLAMEDDESPSV